MSKKNQSKITSLVTSGKNPQAFAGSVNTPIFQTSTVIFPDLESFSKAERGRAVYPITKDAGSYDYGYGIAGTPTTFALQQALCELSGADGCVITPSGLAAITTALLAFLSSGDHVLMVDSVYGPTRRFCNKELKRQGIETTYYNPTIGSDIAALIQPNTKVIFLESPGSLTFEMQDVPAIVAVAKAHNITTIMDNSWAAPLFFQPLSHGVDVEVLAVTKYIGGHSDIILGAVLSKESHTKAINKVMHHYGTSTSPYDCSLALRGLRTVGARLKQQQETTGSLLKWIEAQPEVDKILTPQHPSDAGHDLWKRDYSGAASFFSIVLNQTYSHAQLSAMLDAMSLFMIGVSWGGYESLVIPFDPSAIRTASTWPHKGSCLRFYVGLEDAEDLIADLEAAFKRLRAAK